jgi:membrane protease subunit HflK
MVRKTTNMDETPPSSDPKPDDWRNNLDSDSAEYMLRDFWEKYSRKVKVGVATAGLLMTTMASCYTIPNDSVGIEKTFGRYSGTTKPGLHFLIPMVESVNEVQNQAIFTESFGFRSVKPGVKSEYLGVSEINSGTASKDQLQEIIEGEGLSTDGDLAEKARSILRGEYLMLSGDLNMADVEWIVQYKISDPVAYSFNIRNAKKTLRDVSEAVTRVVVGDASIDEILTTGRADIEIDVKKKLQDKLRMYNTGLEVVLVQLQSSNPPEGVRPSFNAVNSAMQEKQQKINNAMEQYNKEIPKARGDALATIQNAEGYASQRVNNAQGDVARFRQIYAEYKNAPAVTRNRMYLEAMPDILKNSKQIFYLEQGNGNSSLLLKKLDLDGGAK